MPRLATDWRTVVDRNDIDIVDVCTPGDTHMPITVAALQAGKHVLVEKPLANSVAEAETMVEAAQWPVRQANARWSASTIAACPRSSGAIAGRGGRIGELRHVRGAYLQDWLVDPAVPLAWRMRRELAGSGAIGDIGAHVIDLAQFLTGERLTALSADEDLCDRTTASHRGSWRTGRQRRPTGASNGRRRLCPAR